MMTPSSSRISFLLLCILFSCLAIVNVSGSPQLLVTSSNSLLAGRTSSIHVSLLNSQHAQPVGVKVQLFKGKMNTNASNLAVEAEEKMIGVGETSTSFTLSLASALTAGEYTLSCSSSSLSLSVQSRVIVSRRAQLVFVETEKSVYQPGQIVKMLVVAGQSSVDEERERRRV